MNSNFYLPGNYTCIAKQFIRCTLHQLSSNEIFFQLFQCNFESKTLFYKLIIQINTLNLSFRRQNIRNNSKCIE